MKCPKCHANIEPKQFWPIDHDEVGRDIVGLPSQMQDDLLAWWNEARRSKHGPRCTWTRAAWLLSVRRIRKLFATSPDLAAATVEGGIEHGWMALRSEYVQTSQVAVRSTESERDKHMRAALARMNNGRTQ